MICMNGSFKRGAFLGSLLGVSALAFATSKMNPIQKRKIKRSARKAISNMKSGMNLLWRQAAFAAYDYSREIKNEL